MQNELAGDSNQDKTMENTWKELIPFPGKHAFVQQKKRLLN